MKTTAQPAQSSVRDALGRPLRSLRVSVTDRCNLRCLYCMPEKDYVWLPRQELLSFEEISQIVGSFAALGVDRVRLTGGEPLLRHHLDRLVAMLAADSRIRDLALTTNGVLLADQAVELKRAGLHRVTVSLDTLKPERFVAMTQRDEHGRVLAGLAAAQRAGFTGTKIDAVIVGGVNDDELADLVEFARANHAEMRFIEYMDVGGATNWASEKVVSRDEMLSRLEQSFGKITPVIEDSSAPASRYALADGTVFGIIASTTAPFCRSCDRSRLTADGMWYRCLYASAGTDLRGPLRGLSKESASREAIDTHITQIIESTWRAREDRGAELRKAEKFRAAFVPLDELRRNPHLEMHTRGG